MRIVALTKHYIKAYAILFTVLTAFYFFSRLIAIRSLEPFNDEILYAWWAQEGFFHPAQRLISLTDGKQPLFVWLTSLMMTIIPSPIAAGRIVSVLSGWFAMIGLGVLAYQLFRSRSAAFFSSFLYVVYPQAVLLDRYALYDVLLGLCWIWSLIVGVWLVRSPTLGASLVLALTLGAAFLTKSSALFLLPILFVMILIFAKRRSVIVVFGYIAFGVMIAYVYQSVQLLSPFYDAVWGKNNVFVYSLSELKTVSIATLISTNAVVFSNWIISYVTVPLLGAVMIFPFVDRKRTQSYLFLWLAFLIPFISVIFVGKTVYPRHLFFMTLTLLIIGGSVVSHALKARRFRGISIFGVALIFIMLMWRSGSILINFASAPLPAMDRFQYIEGWPAGQGLKEIVRFLDHEAKEAPLTVITEGQYGSMTTTAMELYFGNYPQIQRLTMDEHTLILPTDIKWPNATYIILNKTDTAPTTWSGRELLTIRKGNGTSYMKLYKLSNMRL